MLCLRFEVEFYLYYPVETILEDPVRYSRILKDDIENISYTILTRFLQEILQKYFILARNLVKNTIARNLAKIIIFKEIFYSCKKSCKNTIARNLAKIIIFKEIFQE